MKIKKKMQKKDCIKQVEKKFVEFKIKKYIMRNK